MIATNEELALLEKWKRKLCLQEWRIKLLTHLHPEEMMVRNTAGCLFLWRLRHWNRRFSELYDELRKEIDRE